jgi:hypothetical protein
LGSENIHVAIKFDRMQNIYKKGIFFQMTTSWKYFVSITGAVIKGTVYDNTRGQKKYNR